MPRGFSLGRLFGIRITADVSLLVIVALLTANLALDVLPAWHPEWPEVLRWATGLAGAILFFGSILAHELSHALVARAAGIPVSRITLFIFGGMAHLEREPHGWTAELKTALIGPIISLIIGVTCLAGAVFMLDEGVSAEDPAQFFSALGVGATLLVWLGPVNITLGLFNLVPGFPLDGGRILRAIAWRLTGSFRRATRIATVSGQVVAGLLIALGAAMIFAVNVPGLAGGLGAGLWFILIGWFLYRAAAGTYRDLVMTEKLGAVPVSAIMRQPRLTVQSSTPISRLVDDVLPRSNSGNVPVVADGDHLAGMVSRQDARKIEPGRWDHTAVSEIMQPLGSVPTLPPDRDLRHVLDELEQRGYSELPVVAHGHLVGTVSYTEIADWLARPSL